MLETELKKNTAALIALTEAINASAGVTTSAPPEAAAESSPKAATTETPEPEATAAAEPTDDPVDKKKLTEKFIEVAQEKGREVASKLLAEYSVEKLPQLPEDKWAEFYAKCTALVAS